MDNKFTVVALEGDITTVQAGALKQRISQLIASSPFECLIIDLDKVRYIDSSGLGVLVTAFKRMKERQGAVKLFGLQPRVKAVLDVTRMSQVFEIIDKLPDGAVPA